MCALPDPPVGELVAFFRSHVAEVCEQMIERVSGQIQSPAGLVRVEKSDNVQAEVPLKPLDVRVGAVKYLRGGEERQQNGHRAQTLQKGNSFLNILVIFTSRSVVKTHAAHLFRGILQCSHNSSPTQNTTTGWIIHFDYVTITHNTNFQCHEWNICFKKQMGFHLLSSV